MHVLFVAVYKLVARVKLKKVCLANLLDSLKPLKHKANSNTLECEALKFSYATLIWEWSNLISSTNSGRNLIGFSRNAEVTFCFQTKTKQLIHCHQLWQIEERMFIYQ